MKTIVVYESVYGHTEQYAQWIAKALACDVRKAEGITDQALEAYDTVIFGGPIYAGRIKGIKWLQEHAKTLAGKRLLLFTTGMTDPANEEAYADVVKQALPADGIQPERVFHLPGGIVQQKLKLGHRLIFKMVQKMAGENGISSEMDQTALTPLVAYLQ